MKPIHIEKVYITKHANYRFCYRYLNILKIPNKIIEIFKLGDSLIIRFDNNVYAIGNLYKNFSKYTIVIKTFIREKGSIFKEPKSKFSLTCGGISKLIYNERFIETDFDMDISNHQRFLETQNSLSK